MTQKTCFKCRETKPLSEFYEHPRMADGRLNKCKECTKNDVQENYGSRRAQYSDYDARREQQPGRKSAKLGYQQGHRERNSEKYKARTAVSNALRDGRLKKEPCKHCGTTVRVQAHHADYGRPLDVDWECFKCHREREHGQTVTRA